MVQLDSTVSEADLATFVGKSVLVIGHVGMNMAALEKAREMLGAGMVLEMEDRLTYGAQTGRRPQHYLTHAGNLLCCFAVMMMCVSCSLARFGQV